MQQYYYTMPTFEWTSSTTIRVLDFLVGKKWDDKAAAYVHGLRPSSVRVSKGWLTLDGRWHRVTVMIDDNEIIQSITQEIEVGLPDGVKCGDDLDQLMGN